MIEYPKALYLSGACLNVEDAEHEAAARADGYDDWHADHGRIASQAGDEHIALIKEALSHAFPLTNTEELDRDALKARAAEIGIEHAPNIKTDKLAALVAAAQG